MQLTTDQQVADIYNAIDEPVRARLLVLRELIIEIAKQEAEIKHLQETLKWGEPSYLCKQGSTIRINQVKSVPGQYAIYFNCKSKLIDTLREIYPDQFRYEGNRAILFDIDENIDEAALRHAILLALTYHQRKHLPLLGA